MTVRSFLIDKGLIQPHDVESGQGQFRIECPECKHHNRKCYVDARTEKGVFCFHCKFRRTWRGFQRLYEPPTPEELSLEAFLKTTQERLLNDARLMQYFADRGLTADTVRSLRFGYCDIQQMPKPEDADVCNGLAPNGRWFLGGRIIIPYIRDGYVRTFRGRTHPDDTTTDPQFRYLTLPGWTAQAYYPSEIDAEHPVVLAEGEFDAALLRQNGIQAIGVPGTQSWNARWFDGLNHLYVCMDGDDAGRQATDKAVKEIAEVRRVDMPEGYDISEYVNNFGIESYRALLERSVFYLHGRPQKEDRFSAIVDDFRDWSWSNGSLLGPSMGDWAPRLEDLLSGWQPGLILIGAEAHSGKSCWMVKGLYELCLANPNDTVGVYLSLDDTMEETMKRIVSLHTRIDFNDISRPRHTIAQDKDLLEEYEEALGDLKGIPNIILRDATYGRSLRYLKNFFESLRTKHPDKRLVVFCDSLAKITPDVEQSSDEDSSFAGKNWKAYLASELKYLTTKYKICLVTPTDLRKINGMRRPTRDDLKDAAELAYEAQVILLMYNDLKRQRDNAMLYWHANDDPSNPKESILEVIPDKNKFTGRTGTIRYRMLGPISDFWELSKAEDESWDNAVAEALSKDKKNP